MVVIMSVEWQTISQYGKKKFDKHKIVKYNIRYVVEDAMKYQVGKKSYSGFISECTVLKRIYLSFGTISRYSNVLPLVLASHQVLPLKVGE